MIYMLFAFLGLPEPSLMVAAFASTILVLGFIFGLMAIVFTFQHRSYQRNRGTNILRDERRAYWRYRQAVVPVEDLVKPALDIFRNALLHRDGISYPDVGYEVRDETVVLFARRASVPHPMMLTLSFELSHYLFDPDMPLADTIWERVLGRTLKRTEGQ